MASDGVVLIFWIPMLVVLVAAALCYVFIDKEKNAPKHLVILKPKRIILGMSGAIGGIAVYCLLQTILISLNKVQAGHISSSELIYKFWGDWLYMFAFIGPFLLIGAIVMGLPSLYLLKKFRFLSGAGMLFVSLILGSFYAVYILFFPYNQWCSTNSLNCMLNNFFSITSTAFVIGLFFSLAARFPLWRNVRT